MNLNHLKRKLVSGLLAGTLLLGMTGVSTVNAATASASDYLKQMNKSLSKVESYTAKQTMPLDFSMTMKMDKQKESMKFKTTTTSTQTTINKPDFKSKAVTKVSTSINGEKQTTTQKMYMKKDKKGNIICYSFSDASKTPIKLYPKNDKAAVKNSFVTRAHNWSVLDDNPATREIGEMLREQYHLDEPGLDSDYRKALAEAEQRRKTMGQTAQRSKAQIITPDRYEKITAKKSPLRKGLTGLVDAAILGAANLPVIGDLIDYWGKDDKK